MNRRQVLASATILLSGCGVVNDKCGPGPVEIREISRNYDQYIGDQVTIEGSTEENVHSSNPEIYDSTGWAYIRTSGDVDFGGNECLRTSGTVLHEDEIPAVPESSTEPDIAVEAETVKVQ